MQTLPEDRALNSFAAVSYTHLDVYKRQILHRSGADSDASGAVIKTEKTHSRGPSRNGRPSAVCLSLIHIFEARAGAYISQHQMLQKGDTVIVALSGGADSMALFHFLFSVQNVWGLRLRAAHVLSLIHI